MNIDIDIELLNAVRGTERKIADLTTSVAILAQAVMAMASKVGTTANEVNMPRTETIIKRNYFETGGKIGPSNKESKSSRSDRGRF